MIFDATIRAGDVITIIGFLVVGVVGFAVLRRDVSDMKDEIKELRKVVTNQAVLEQRVTACEDRIEKVEGRIA